MIEQVLNALMGAADTMMVSNAGSAAISAVSLVDSINILVLYVFTAMATGGTIICSQYIGHRDEEMACQAGKQLVLSVTDPELIEATGGIVQGMSGSPIIQDGKLIGAVTHVLVGDPTMGYGIYIGNMLDAAA